jgi:hypothetical protein
MPLMAEANAVPTGMRQTVTAINNPTARPAKAACHAGRLNIPRRTRTVAMGSIATRKDSDKLSPTGVNNW